jgi:hypothetical protein
MAVGEWDQRQLCPDGSCVGVIGPDGTCKVCGRAAPNWGDERKRGLIDPPEDDDEERDIHDEEDDDYDYDASGEGDDDDDEDDEDGGEDDDGDDDEVVEAAAASEHAVAGAGPRSDWTARRLCPDGGCIGLIGADGHCRVCGRAVSDVPDEPSRDGAAANAEAAAAAPATASSDAGDASSDPAPIRAPAAAEPERCPDASCAGAVGSDGRCEVCGKGAS